MEIYAGHLSSKELFWSAAQRLKVSEQWLFMLIHCVLDHKWWLETIYIYIKIFYKGSRPRDSLTHMLAVQKQRCGEKMEKKIYYISF